MKYTLKNGKSVCIRKPTEDDAMDIITVISTADQETKFLARNPGEFQTTIEKEQSIISNVLNSTTGMWFVAECDGKVVGQCSVGLVRGYQRYRHRAEVAFVLLEAYCNIGIGGKMMEECIEWCINNCVTQIELDVVTTNTRALKMYQNYGFEIVGTIPNALRYLGGTYADEYKMVKYL
ncbi:GNAT family N-acetyltransferase [Anaeromicropila herbilytica]|uniref:GNAT family N-acetyltransferase n=1 Tax=Anaeromicropila herbilytica TaxID=2785025 RepID=A0A7R7EL58_9FIRM|nr:N-acetyltransferase [Anaeromicropila herbilytica]BCN30870.1 GNAT family N-acetyltransferase [Anaeromicropila herbilytica]